MRRLLVIMVAVCLCVMAAPGEEEAKTEGRERTQEESSREAEKKPATKEEILKRVEEKLSGIETVQADFVQEKDLAMFKHKMVIRGSLAVKNPDRIAWHVQEPVRYSMVIREAVLKQWDEDTNQVQTLRLDKNPSFKPVFKQLSGWFAGRYAEVRKRYEVTVRDRSPVTLVFRPKKDTGMEKVIEQVVVVFRDDERYIRQLKVLQVNGDKTTFRFLDTRLNEPIDEDVWKVRPDE